MSKQALHQFIERSMRQQEQAGLLSHIIEQIRRDHPTLSCRAMYYKINPQNIGRDSFEQLCSELGYKAERPRNWVRTTNSFGVKRFENLLKDMVLTGINQAWSSDITYFEVKDCFYYLTFILDCYSRRIIGHSVSKRLTTEDTTLPALKAAIKLRNASKLPENIVFHSDGGGQYYDKAFLNCTQKHKFRNSMCEYAYENGKAERINGIIKNNYLAHYQISTFEDLAKNVDRAILLYNNDRPHKSLGYRSPKFVEENAIILPTANKADDDRVIDAITKLTGHRAPQV